MAGNSLVPKKVIATKSDGSTYQTTVHVRPGDGAATNFQVANGGVPRISIPESSVDLSRYPSVTAYEVTDIDSESGSVRIDGTFGVVTVQPRVGDDGFTDPIVGYPEPTFEPSTAFIDSGADFDSIKADIDGLARDVAFDHEWYLSEGHD